MLLIIKTSIDANFTVEQHHLHNTRISEAARASPGNVAISQINTIPRRWATTTKGSIKLDADLNTQAIPCFH
ncbi:hypothetical protein D5086_006892 [Populus alba]|uniref:Uncharacterized protein n=1 Tax=Populus alba TaxID=43335 RepID=A0ACC4CN59_POPAL